MEAENEYSAARTELTQALVKVIDDFTSKHGVITDAKSRHYIREHLDNLIPEVMSNWKNRIPRVM